MVNKSKSVRCWTDPSKFWVLEGYIMDQGLSPSLNQEKNFSTSNTYIDWYPYFSYAQKAYELSKIQKQF